jgi:hypothetical protein
MEMYFFCFYQLQVKKEKLYHHVIIKAKDEGDVVRNLITKDYQYYLRAVSPVYLTEKDKDNPVFKHLIFDGESLVARIRENSINQTNNKPSKSHESS